jgi:hypothetical protein
MGWRLAQVNSWAVVRPDLEIAVFGQLFADAHESSGFKEHFWEKALTRVVKVDSAVLLDSAKLPGVGAHVSDLIIFRNFEFV